MLNPPENFELYALTNRFCDTLLTVRRQLLDFTAQAPKPLTDGICTFMDQFRETANKMRRNLGISDREEINPSAETLSSGRPPDKASQKRERTDTVKRYSRVRLKTGEYASIVEILQAGKVYLVDVDQEDGSTITDLLHFDQIDCVVDCDNRSE